MAFKSTVTEFASFQADQYTNSNNETQCVEFVKQTTNLKSTTTGSWKAGKRVLDCDPGTVPKYTAIATFDDSGKYPTDKKGKHAAVYLSHNSNSITVLDQSKDSTTVKQRTILSKDSNSRSNDARTFYIIEI